MFDRLTLVLVIVTKASVEGSGSVAVSGNFVRLDVDFAFPLLQTGIPLLIHHPSNAPGEPWTKHSWLTATMKVTWLEGLTKLGLQNLGPFFQAEANSIRRLVFQFLKQPFGWCSSPSLWTL